MNALYMKITLFSVLLLAIWGIGSLLLMVYTLLVLAVMAFRQLVTRADPKAFRSSLGTLKDNWQEYSWGGIMLVVMAAILLQEDTPDIAP